MERWTPKSIDGCPLTQADGKNAPRDFFVGGISYPPKGKEPSLKRHDGKPDDCAIEVSGHGFILLCDRFDEAFKFPTEHDAKRIAALVGGAVEFIP